MQTASYELEARKDIQPAIGWRAWVGEYGAAREAESRFSALSTSEWPAEYCKWASYNGPAA